MNSNDLKKLIRKRIDVVLEQEVPDVPGNLGEISELITLLSQVEVGQQWSEAIKTAATELKNLLSQGTEGV